jgi:hypothetical protein
MFRCRPHPCLSFCPFRLGTEGHGDLFGQTPLEIELAKVFTEMKQPLLERLNMLFLVAEQAELLCGNT